MFVKTIRTAMDDYRRHSDRTRSRAAKARAIDLRMARKLKGGRVA